MKHINGIWVLILAAVFACGGAVDNETLSFDDGEYQDSMFEPMTEDDIGTSELALTADAGYGQESDLSRCFTPWNGSLCLVALSKTRNVAFACGGDAEAQQECLNAKTDGLNELHTGTGFNFTIKQINDASVNAIVKAGTVAGSALVSYVPTVNHANDSAGPGGTFQKVTRSTCTVDVDKLKAKFPTDYQNPPENVRRNAYYHLYKRGWGLCAAQLGLQSGTAAAVMFSGNPSGGAKQQFTNTEKTFLTNYQP